MNKELADIIVRACKRQGVEAEALHCRPQWEDGWDVLGDPGEIMTAIINHSDLFDNVTMRGELIRIDKAPYSTHYLYARRVG